MSEHGEGRYYDHKTIKRAIQEAKENINDKLDCENRTMLKTTARQVAQETIRIITDGLKAAEVEDKIRALEESRTNQVINHNTIIIQNTRQETYGSK